MKNYTNNTNRPMYQSNQSHQSQEDLELLLAYQNDIMYNVNEKSKRANKRERKLSSKSNRNRF